MEFTNTALVHEEVLLDVLLVLEHGWPAGPSFLHSLRTLTEAVVIHAEVYYDPLHYTRRGDLNGSDVHSLIRDSQFVQQLVSEGAYRRST